MAKSAGLAKSLFSRLKGLLGSAPLTPGEGLYLVPCSSIHMFGMRFAIDAIFVDRAGIVVGLVKDLQPGQMSGYFWRAHGCLELPAGTITATKTALGDKLTFKEIH